jgi:ubiquinone biosynthesis protein Coq4
MTSITAEKGPALAEAPPEPFRQKGGMNEQEAAYMRGDAKPVAGSVPMSTSKFLNSPLFVHAFTTMSLRRMGNDVPVTYDIPTMSRGLADVADYAEAARLVAEERIKNPEFGAWLDRRRPLRIDADAVKDCAEGTFGAALRDFMAKGYKVDFVHDFEAATDLEYLIKQIGWTHDIQHLATGFGPNHAGEHALAHMNIASTYNHLSPELAGFLCMANQFVSVALMSRVGLHYRAAMPIILDATRQGIEAGQKLKTLLFMVDWDDYYDWPLEKLSAHLGIERGPGDAWDYTEELCTG